MDDANPMTSSRNRLIQKPRVTLIPEGATESSPSYASTPDEVRALRQEIQRLQMENNALREQVQLEKANIKRYVPVIQDGDVVLAPLDLFSREIPVAESVPVQAWDAYFGDEAV